MMMPRPDCRRAVLLGLASLLLGACTSTPRAIRSGATDERAPTIEVGIAVPSVPVVEVPVAAQVSAPVAPTSPWDRLRGRLSMPGCEYSPAALHWAGRYTRGPQKFADTLKRALPFLLLVLEELEKRDIPGEFALLPYLESHYEPIATRGNTPAGMWQMMPDTARGLNLKVSRDYDGRLDALASSQAAAALLRRYGDEFGDWRLVDMAFNAGEYRVKKLLRDRKPPHIIDDLSQKQMATLRLNPITHEHLAKLLALGCIVRDPQRFNVSLPEPDSDDRLVQIELEAPLDIRIAAGLADLPTALMRRYNAAYRNGAMLEGSAWRLLMPEPAVEHFRAGYSQLPAREWSDWTAAVLHHPLRLDELAGQVGVPTALLATVNHTAQTASIGVNATVFIPRASLATVGAKLADEPAAATPTPTTITVRSGDNLWDLARMHSVSVAQLRRWNQLSSDAVLKPGQQLRLHE